ncbi:GntR family transcriptional regulator [Rhodobacteraceae bacterium XHP0102]|nr:GntR family transcriptional regulator [Rhodobacteraceae bacterium XHP0102]
MRLRDHAYSNFTERLLARDIEPGQILSQRELVELTGRSLGAIREMIPRLEADGLIKTVPKRGLQVLSIDIELVRNAFQLRSMIETEAISNYCKVASQAEIDEIHAQHVKLKTMAIKGMSPEALKMAQKTDWDFHDMIVDRMGNKMISDIYRVNMIKIRLIRNSQTSIQPNLLLPVLEEHLAIIHALGERNISEAIHALHAHIDSAKTRALNV